MNNSDYLSLPISKSSVDFIFASLPQLLPPFTIHSHIFDHRIHVEQFQNCLETALETADLKQIVHWCWFFHHVLYIFTVYFRTENNHIYLITVYPEAILDLFCKVKGSYNNVL